ncbi:MAG: GNAT family N-acetyltransferase [Dehalococcoidia bacterium]|nr:GNAT family N-acetyltransferase [Dehalococcoidia bacterium]
MGWQEQPREGPVKQRTPRVGIESPLQEEVAEMIEALDTYLNAMYPDGSNYLLDVDSLTAENVSFLVARVDGQAAGCGALVLDHLDYAEIKRMYVKPEARRLGIGAAILQELEQIARNADRSLVRLETGVHQPEALGLYRRAGYVDRGPFGDYPPDPVSVFMEKPL